MPFRPHGPRTRISDRFHSSTTDGREDCPLLPVPEPALVICIFQPPAKGGDVRAVPSGAPNDTGGKSEYRTHWRFGYCLIGPASGKDVTVAQ